MKNYYIKKIFTLLFIIMFAFSFQLNTFCVSTQSNIESTLKGRGNSDSGMRAEPQYVGIIGWVAVGAGEEYNLKTNRNFATMDWLIPTYKEIESDDLNNLDKHYAKNGSVLHKTKVVVLSQRLKHSGWGLYTGYLNVKVVDTNEEMIIKVNNFVVRPYWEKELVKACLEGMVIAQYHQVSEYKPCYSSRPDSLYKINEGAYVIVKGIKGGYNGELRCECSIPDRNSYASIAIYQDDLTLIK